MTDRLSPERRAEIELIVKLREELKAVALIGPDYRAAIATVDQLSAHIDAVEQELEYLRLKLSQEVDATTQLLARSEAAEARVRELEQVIRKVRAHTGYLPHAPIDLLAGLLQSIERIADAALGEPPIKEWG